MKKTLIIISVAALALVACTEITETYEDPAPQLEVTSAYVMFGADGGSKTVLVTSSSDWTCSASDSWYSLVQGDGSLEISAEVNTSSANRYSTVTVTAEGLSETISVAQAMASAVGEDLSADETSNCYLAATETSYRFNAIVKGNGKSVDFGGIAAYVEAYGTTVNPDDIVYADLLWEAALDGDKTRSLGIIDGKPVYSDGYVYFTTGTGEGNAVIAIRDAQGTVLWSWHIWVTDQEIADIEGNGHYWMDRNLGANTTEPEDINNRGLLYQWGRKDPFLPSNAPYGSEDNNAINYETGDGTGTWNFSSFTTKFATEAPGNIPLSVKNPMSALLVKGSIYQWYLTSANDDAYTSFLWGDSSDLSTYVKSIFDPCPPGYNVPVTDPWISEKDQDVNYWSTDAPYGRYWTGGNNAYYPCAGELNGSTGALINTGAAGYYWTSGMLSDASYLSRYMYFTPMTAITYSTQYPVHAMAVRCMRAE